MLTAVTGVWHTGADRNFTLRPRASTRSGSR